MIVSCVVLRCANSVTRPIKARHDERNMMIDELEPRMKTGMNSTMKLDRADIARVVSGTWSTPVDAGDIGRIRIDSRRVGTGDVFVALVGERNDAHRYLSEVSEAGASFAIVRQGRAVPDLPCLQVEDTLEALEALARRARADASAKVVAITGSNGKTTTRSLMAAVVDESECVLEPEQNFNNHIGLPLTLTRLAPHHRIAVLELGMNHPGEISHLSAIARPHVAVITNIGRAHLGPVGGIDAVRRAKMEIVDGLEPGGVLVVPVNDRQLAIDGEARGVRVITVGTEAHASVRVRIEGPTARARYRVGYAGGAGDGVEAGSTVELAAPGHPFALAAVLAMGVADVFGVARERVLARLSTSVGVPGRMSVRICSGVTVLDDTYNANPDSMIAALATLRSMEVAAGGRRVAVLGDMAELGEQTEAAHRELAAHFVGLDHVYVIGDSMQAAADAAVGGGNVTVFPDLNRVIDALSGDFRSGDVVLFKGSRSAGLERVIDALFPDGELR
jgi:UDP-N-acetylmuramoyl-tripeptide--D-alanyl-D-alanine ligase